MTDPAAPSNRSLLLPYLLPYATYVLLGALPLSAESVQLARLLLTGAALGWAWPRYVPLRGPRRAAGSVAAGVGAGLAGLAIWIALVLPFAPSTAEPPSPSALALRTAGATLLVPVLEELLLRGYVLRLVLQWERARSAGAAHPMEEALDRSHLREVEPGAWTLASAAVSTTLFALGHRPFEWLAASAYGALMVALWARRGDLLVCVVAHAVTNLALALYVWRTGSWSIW